MATGVYRDGDSETDSRAVSPTREEIKEKVDVHPCLTEHLCPSEDRRERAKFYKRTKGMLRRGEIRFEFFLNGKTGHPSRVLSQRNVERDKLRHEVMLTTALLAMGHECRRLTDVDPQLLPDAEMIVRGELHYVEMHTGTMRGRKIENRLSLYERVGSPVLWIVLTETERHKLRQRDRNENSYFGIFEEVVNNPEGNIWLGVGNQFLTL